MHDPTDDGLGQSDRSAADTGIDRPVTEAKRYVERADERPEGVCPDLERTIELLVARHSTGRPELEQRVVASGAVARVAESDPASLAGFLPELVEQLRRETASGGSAEAPETRDMKQTVRANLVETVSHLISNTSETTVGQDAFTDFVGAVSTDLDDGTLRVATKALFMSADERAEELATVAELLDELLTYPDGVIQAWAAGTVGRVAATHPDAVAATAVNLRRLLTHEQSTVQHNAVEALARLVGPRPDVVGRAAGPVRNLLDHEDVAIQYNAAGVLCVLAERQPEAVVPAVMTLQKLRSHDDDAVRRIATITLAQLARERPDAATDSKSEHS